ncbi:MAG: hypothetical protein MUP14_05240 [Dehalococcoidia bacterium]|nr:hypothetical protein [Dehalococcoidia bacterium]
MKAKRGVICPLVVLAALLAVVAVMAQWDTARAAGQFRVTNTFEVHNAEHGAQCDNAVDDDNDGSINDGCPNAGPVNPVVGKAELVCDDDVDDDADTKVNDGCPAKGPTAAGDHGDVIGRLAIPTGDYMYAKMTITFSPAEFTASGDIPVGAWVADIYAESTLGLLNGPCTTALTIDFNMFNATLDKSKTVTFTDSSADLDGNGLADGVDKYPDYLDGVFPGLTPAMRLFGVAGVAGTPVTMNILYFEPGTPLLGLTPDASLGVASVSVLNNPNAMLAPNSITDNCTPMSAITTNYGYSWDNPNTAADESGKVFMTNPTTPGDYKFTMYAFNRADADGDGIESYKDTCPFDVNEGDPLVRGDGDTDKDGIDNACDPTPDEDTNNGDHDADMYVNRGDLCVLVDNYDQKDTDNDDIGDACDTVGAGGIGLGPDKRDGELLEVYLPSTVKLTGAAAAPTPTTVAPAVTPTTVAPAVTPTTVAPAVTPTTVPAVTPKPTPTVAPAVTPKPTPTVAPKPTTVAPASPVPPTGGGGLLRSDGGFPAWAMYFIAVAVALMVGSIGMAATVAWRRRQ